VARRDQQGEAGKGLVRSDGVGRGGASNCNAWLGVAPARLGRARDGRGVDGFGLASAGWTRRGEALLASGAPQFLLDKYTSSMVYCPVAGCARRPARVMEHGDPVDHRARGGRRPRRRRRDGPIDPPGDRAPGPSAPAPGAGADRVAGPLELLGLRVRGTPRDGAGYRRDRCRRAPGLGGGRLPLRALPARRHPLFADDGATLRPSMYAPRPLVACAERLRDA